MTNQDLMTNAERRKEIIAILLSVGKTHDEASKIAWKLIPWKD